MGSKSHDQAEYEFWVKELTPVIREQIAREIAAEIMAIDLSEAKAISSDYFAGAIRMRTVASIVAQKGLGK